MQLFKQYGVKDHRAAAGHIPVIDYGPYFAGAPGALERVAVESPMHVRKSASFMLSTTAFRTN